MSNPLGWEEISREISRQGPFLAAAAEVADLREHFNFLPGARAGELTHAISLGYPLSESVMEEIDDRPTILYKHHYRQVNMILDRAATVAAAFIQSHGWRALPVPASVFVDWRTQAPHLSHKMMAYRTGLGWIGRNLLLVTPEWGARVRLVTVLTDMPVESPARPKGECGDCKRCAVSCPVGAIYDGPGNFDFLSCHDLNRYHERHGMSVRICGVCVKACGPGSGRIISG